MASVGHRGPLGRGLAALGLLLMLACLLACSLACSLVTTPTPELAPPADTPGPSPTPSPEPTVPATEAGGFQVTVDNRSSYEVCYVFIAPTEDERWGEDWLSLDDVIPPGTSWTFAVPPGAHDVMVQDCDAAALGTAWEVTSDTTLTVGAPGTVPLRVVNEGATPVCYVYISPTEAEMWGEDRMGRWETLEPEGGARVFFVSPGVYDLSALDCQERQVAMEVAVQVDAEATWTIAPAPRPEGEALTVTVDNRTSIDLCHVYITGIEADTWGIDWLGGDEVIAPGDRRTFGLAEGAYDVSVVDCEGAVVATAWDVASDTALEPGAAGEVALRIVNTSETDVCYVYIAPASGDAWGEDRLNGLEIIPAQGGARAFYLEPGSYDLLAQTCEGEDFATGYEVEVQETFVWTLE